MGGASVGGLSPVAGTTNTGITTKGNLDALAFYKYSFGSEYYRNDSKAELGNVASFRSQYLGLYLNYGVFDELSIDAELGYFVEKTQDFQLYELTGKGFSHINLNSKYKIFSDKENEIELTAGAGVKLPFNLQKLNLPIHIQPSQNSYGIISYLFFHKGYFLDDVHLFFVNRNEYLFENRDGFQYGTAFVSSVFGSYQFIDDMNFVFELRNEIKEKDLYLGIENLDSGYLSLIAAPQISYRIDSYLLSFMFEMPLYKYYNGYQLTNDYNFGFFISKTGIF